MLTVLLMTHFLCKGHTPLELRMNLSILSDSRITMTLDSEFHYPHTGQSWKLLMEKTHDDHQGPESSANFTTYDDSFIYNLSLPQALLSGESRKYYRAELRWQTDEKGAIFSEELRCYSSKLKLD